MKNYVMFIALAFISASCQKDSLNELNNDTKVLDENVYEVYNAIVAPYSSIRILINETDSNKNCSIYANISERDTNVDESIIEECMQLNKKSYAIDGEKIYSGGIKVVSQNKINEFGSFEEALNNYGAVGAYRFGHPVFYDSGNKCMLETGYVCGGTCGNGSILLLEKVSGEWVIKNNYITWVSK